MLLAYMLLVLWYTLLRRDISGVTPHPDPLWSYAEWFSGNRSVGRQIIGNVLMFIPVGFGLAFLSKRKSAFLVALLLTVCIETLQLVTMRGTYEFDDVLNNMLGSAVGWFAFGKVRLEYATEILVASVIAFSFVCMTAPEYQGNVPRVLYFQVGRDGKGSAFLYGRDTPQRLSFALRSTKTGGLKRLDAETYLARPDVNAYFDCEQNYTWSGFQADVEMEGEWEYYVIAGPLLLIPTGTYISENGVHYVAEDGFKPPELDEDFVSVGTPLVCRPDEHCWVYQYGDCLYWVADEGFRFEDDGSTYIQYQLWTTRPDRLPHVRIENGWDWDNIGGNFEDYELAGDFGRYRVMRCHLPTAYPITSVMTGYYVNSSWIWCECFRPVYYLP